MAAQVTFVVIEMQNGQVGNNAWVYDTREDAEVKYFQVLSETVKSPVDIHTVILCTSEGYVIDTKSYRHFVETNEDNGSESENTGESE